MDKSRKNAVNTLLQHLNEVLNASVSSIVRVKDSSFLLRFQGFNLSPVNLYYSPASNFMKTVGFSTIRSQ